MGWVKVNAGARFVLPLIVASALLLAGCGGAGSPKAEQTAAAPADTTAPDAASDPGAAEASLPPGAQPGLDDLNGDGAADPTCGSQDFGGGLVLRIPCSIPNPNDPEDGTRLVRDSLYRLPAFEADLTGISGSLVTARDTNGMKVVVLVFNSDNLFATGSDQLNESNTLDATIRLINDRFANAAIQVRGHTDKTGTASGNQSLSLRRAETVRTYLTGHGTKALAVTSVGLGSAQPLVEETNADGSVNVPGRAFNRRVEIAIRLN